MKEIKKRIPVKEGLFTMPSNPDEKPRLIASECPSCGEVLFPKRKMCANCQEEKLREITLSPRGKIYSFSVVMQRPGRYYEGPVPYAFGWVEFPEKVRGEGLFVCDNFEDLRIGREVEVVIEKLTEDQDGNEVVAHKFRLIGPSKES
ncbi:MAG TPA: OB-fold domain-containing protein [Thermodesulfobacteriota bacterium]|nr:OB-fold domain-containing protein [Thermodesulfobacteriota bacterium]